MVEFETIQQEEIKLGKGLLLVATKKVIAEDGEKEFVQLSKADSSGRFRQTLTIPRDKEIVSELARLLQTVV